MNLFSITDTLKNSLVFVGAEYFSTNLSDGVLLVGAAAIISLTCSTFHYSLVGETHRAGRFIFVSLTQPGCLMRTPQDFVISAALCPS